MAISTRAVRWTVLGAAVLLVVVLVGFVTYAHRRAQQYLAGLPGRLGIDIKQETDNVTYSQSYRGRTVFTVHAAKQIQHADGKYTMRDVGIVLYGKDGERTDRIHGQQFEYDAKNGIMTAVGEVFLDLEGPEKGGDQASRVIHVKTSGLTYLQKERQASTGEAIEFQVGAVSGKAVGAAYTGDTGVVVLEHAVEISGLHGVADRARPMHLTAAHAELDRTGNQVQLEGAKFVQEDDRGAQTIVAEHALVKLTEDGTPRQMDASGHVALSGDGRGTVSAQRMDVDFDTAGKPRTAHLAGGVHYVDNVPARAQSGLANEAVVSFDPAGKPAHATLTGAVALDQTAASNSRKLRADRVELALANGARGRTILRGAVATASDGAALRLVDTTAKVHVVMDVRAAMLTGRFGPNGAANGLDGAGKTSLTRVTSTAAGAFVSRDTSLGPLLRIDFAPDIHGKLQLARVVQSGGITTEAETAPKKQATAKPQTPAAANETDRARAQEVDYDAGKDTVALIGGVQVEDAESVLLADRVDADRASGDALAQGNVRVSYAEPAPPSAAAALANAKPAAKKLPEEPVHVIAARAVSHKRTGVTEFTAAPGAQARLWQAGSAVEAPEIDFDRKGKTVAARANATAVLVSAKGEVVRVSGASMLFRDAARTLAVAGPVRVLSAGGKVSASEATVYLLPPAAPGAKAAAAPGVLPGFAGGKVERVVATGDVVVEQPGRRATGQRLVYTAADGIYVMTGSPRLVDAARGTVTGASLRFRKGEEAVIVSGEGGRVHTETQVPQ